MQFAVVMLSSVANSVKLGYPSGEPKQPVYLYTCPSTLNDGMLEGAAVSVALVVVLGSDVELAGVVVGVPVELSSVGRILSRRKVSAIYRVLSSQDRDWCHY